MHRGGISRHKDKYTQYLSIRNRYLMLLKNEDFWGFLKFTMVFLLYDLWRNLFILMINHKYFFMAYHDIKNLSNKIFNKRG